MKFSAGCRTMAASGGVPPLRVVIAKHTMF
jgi:hypothetical protein